METEKRLEEMENSMEQMNSKLDEVLDCLKGNDMGSTGLVKKISILEEEVQEIKDKGNIEKTKSDIYMGIIKWLGAAITLLALGYMFSQAYKN